MHVSIHIAYMPSDMCAVLGRQVRVHDDQSYWILLRIQDRYYHWHAVSIMHVCTHIHTDHRE
jgi:hypothetical protein